jgi:hypothetical protein
MPDGAGPVRLRVRLQIAVNQSEQLAAAAQEAGVNVTTCFPEKGNHEDTPAWHPEEVEERIVGVFRSALGL